MFRASVFVSLFNRFENQTSKSTTYTSFPATFVIYSLEPNSKEALKNSKNQKRLSLQILLTRYFFNNNTIQLLSSCTIYLIMMLICIIIYLFCFVLFFKCLSKPAGITSQAIKKIKNNFQANSFKNNNALNDKN